MLQPREGRATRRARCATTEKDPVVDCAGDAGARPATDQIATADANPQARRTHARFLYFQGWRCKSIAEFLTLPPSTVYGWKDAERWDEAVPLDRVNGALEMRLVQLVLKEQKTGGDFKEIDLLGRQLERTARVERYQQTGKEGDLNPNIATRTAAMGAAKRRAARNEFGEEQLRRLEALLLEQNFPFHQTWFEQQRQRTRALLKSRQIGATFYFSHATSSDTANATTIESRNGGALLRSSAGATLRGVAIDVAQNATVRGAAVNVTGALGLHTTTHAAAVEIRAVDESGRRGKL